MYICKFIYEVFFAFVRFWSLVFLVNRLVCLCIVFGLFVSVISLKHHVTAIRISLTRNTRVNNLFQYRKKQQLWIGRDQRMLNTEMAVDHAAACHRCCRGEERTVVMCVHCSRVVLAVVKRAASNLKPIYFAGSLAYRVRVGVCELFHLRPQLFVTIGRLMSPANLSRRCARDLGSSSQLVSWCISCTIL